MGQVGLICFSQRGRYRAARAAKKIKERVCDLIELAMLLGFGSSKTVVP